MPETSEEFQSGKRKGLIRVCLLGSEGSGKTCFLAGLAILGEPNRPSPLTVTPTDEVTVSYLNELANTLRRQEWPPPTNMTSVLTIRVGIDHSLIEIVVVDYPGEDFREALRTLRHEQIETLYEHYSLSDSILLLFDPHTDLTSVPQSASLGEKQIERQMAHLQAIADIWAERSTNEKGKARTSVDVGIVLTKCDTVESLETTSQAQAYFRKHAAGLDQKIRQHAKEVKYFAMSAIGGAHGRENHEVPGPTLEPFGYAQLFKWVRRRHSLRRNRIRRRVTVGFVIALALLVMGRYLYLANIRHNQLATLANPNLSAVEKLQRTMEATQTVVLLSRAEVLRGVLAEAKRDLGDADSELAIERIVKLLKQCREAHPGVLSSEIDDLLQDAEDKNQDILFNLVTHLYEIESSDFKDSASKFLREYPTSSRCEEVRKMLAEYQTIQLQAARNRIKAIAVRSQSSLLGKSERIFEFLQENGGDLEEEEKTLMKRAAELGRQFSERHTYSLTLKRSGGFLKPRSQGVWLVVDDKTVQKRDSSRASRSVTWPRDVVKIQWQSGESVKIILRDRGYGDEDVAWMTDRGAVALRLLGSKQTLTQFAKGWKKHCDEAFVEYKVDGITPSDWKAVEAYLTPGRAW